ncbi:MAG: LysR family transcriptional regulator [Coriobacteriales bacterium]|jgi:DNA-binding transcriptional LysR family regulator
MQVDTIEMILALDKTRSISQAAEELYMSRAGLSQKLASAESSYGTPLFTRTSTGVVPTRAGQIVTRYAKQISQIEASLAAELAANDESFDSTLEIGMSLNDGVALLPELVARFHIEHPNALVHLEAGYEPGLVEQVKQGKLDFALVENQPADAETEIETLGYSMLEFCAPDRPPYNTARQPVSVETLLDWPMIIYEWNSGRHMVGNRHFRERYGVSLNDHNLVARFDTHEAMINGAKAGLGWATVPHCIATRHRLDSGLLWFTVDTDPMRYPVNLIWKKDHVISSLAMEFRQFIVDNVPKDYFRDAFKDEVLED